MVGSGWCGPASSRPQTVDTYAPGAENSRRYSARATTVVGQTTYRKWGSPKQSLNSRQNAVRHGLSAETVVVPIEDAEDYKSFEASIVLDYDAQSAVERELVLRLASLLWRLRRATAVETRLFERVSEGPNESEPAKNEGDFVEIFGPSRNQVVARCFLRLARLEDGIFDRLSRYEAALWRQVGQTLFTLDSWSDESRRKGVAVCGGELGRT